MRWRNSKWGVLLRHDSFVQDSCTSSNLYTIVVLWQSSLLLSGESKRLLMSRFCIAYYRTSFLFDGLNIYERRSCFLPQVCRVLYFRLEVILVWMYALHSLHLCLAFLSSNVLEGFVFGKRTDPLSRLRDGMMMMQVSLFPSFQEYSSNVLSVFPFFFPSFFVAFLSSFCVEV